QDLPGAHARLATITMASPAQKLGLAVALFWVGSVSAQVAATLEGQITDPSGAAVPQASIQVVGPHGIIQDSRTDTQGRYRFTGLPDGDYRIVVTSPGFARYASPNLHFTSSRLLTFDVRLEIQQEKQNVTVSDTGSQLGVDASQSVGQIVLRGSDLDSLPDDAEDLANALQMLAGSDEASHRRAAIQRLQPTPTSLCPAC
ncbi:MAG TPA: carboxypeptidase-like regulatory domain-containing protein, partial [Bryobacteraceae bacterium]|nr:carboxypeptidase-like regulatory domain-containing protein [Bryobacteraceae bacterium]